MPTYLRVKGTAGREEKTPVARQIPYDGGISYVYMETDAPDDYVTREKDPGELQVDFPDDVDGSYHAPHGGLVRIKVTSKGAKFGGAGDLTALLTRHGGEPLRCMVQLYYGDPPEDEDDDDKADPDPPGGGGGVRLPHIKWIGRDGWDTLDWNEDDISRVSSDAIEINRDCRYLQDFKKIRPASDADKITARFGMSVYIASLLLDHDLRGSEQYDENFRMAITAVAKSCLPASYDFAATEAAGKFVRAAAGAPAGGGGHGSE